MNGNERNERCTTCGRKLKACKGHEPSSLWKWYFLLFVAIALVCAFPLTLRSLRKNEGLDTSHPYTFSGEYLRMQSAYFKRHETEHWWLQSSDITEEQIPEMTARLYETRNHITRVLAQYRDTNAATQHIADRFTRLQPSVFTQGVSRQLLYEDDVANALTKLELCFIAENEQHNTSLVPNFAWYRAEWHAVMLAAIDIPDGLLAELLYHELWHAFTHHDGSPSATAHGMSDTFVAEEVYAHDRIGTPVLDRATNDAFSKLVGKILGRKTGKEVHIAELLELIQPEDLVALDTMLGVKDSGSIVAGTVFGDLTIAIVFAYTETTKDPVEERMRSYRWFTQYKP